MPQIVIFLEDLGPGEKGIAEMLAPVSIRRVTLCFLIVNITRSSPAFTVITGACMGGPRTCHWVGGSGLSSPGNRGQCAFQCFPDKWGRVPEVGFSGGTLSKNGLKARPWVWTLPWRSLSECCDHSLLTFILSLFLFQVLFFFF
jgi:hypothetical protein